MRKTDLLLLISGKGETDFCLGFVAHAVVCALIIIYLGYDPG